MDQNLSMRNSISQLLRELRPQLNSRRSERRARGGGLVGFSAAVRSQEERKEMQLANDREKQLDTCRAGLDASAFWFFVVELGYAAHHALAAPTGWRTKS